MGSSRLVYSTDGGGTDYCPDCGRPKSECRCASRRRQPSAGPARQVPDDGVVRVFRDRSGRHGRTVTLVTGVRADPASLDSLATTLTRLCGSGGGVKDGAIEIQGDHREKVAAKLRELGHRVKLAGG